MPRQACGALQAGDEGSAGGRQPCQTMKGSNPLFGVRHRTPDNREAHLAYIEATGVVTQAGPLLDETGEMTGSLVVLDVPDMPAAQDWADNDPYAKAGLFETVTLRAWKKVV